MQKGFTLLEVLVTISVVAVLIGVAVPSIDSFVQNNRLIAASNDLVSAMHIARSEAIKNNTRVTVCASSNGTTCATNGDWKDGWVVFLDGGGNGDTVGTGIACSSSNVGSDCLLRSHDGYTDPQLSITALNDSNAAAYDFTFTSRGTPKTPTGDEKSGTFSLCTYDSSNNVTGSRAVVLAISGSSRVTDNTAVITCPATP